MDVVPVQVVSQDLGELEGNLTIYTYVYQFIIYILHKHNV